MCPIVDGTPVDAATTNPQLLDAVSDDTALGKLTLANTDPASGTSITSIQKEHNSIASFVGKSVNTAYNALPTWTSNDVGSSTDPVKTRADSLSAKFNNAIGHAHSGSAGDGVPITASNLVSVPLKGYILQGADLTGVIGSSTTVTTEMTGKTNSTGPTVTGVVVTAPNNKVLIRQATGANQDDVYKDGSGNVVYGRITFSAGPVWTLSYYVNLSGAETAYSFGSASDVRWYYQELYNPMVSPPVYSEFASIPSDNATADVITATTSLQGKVSLSSTAPGEIASAGSAGTATASVANADHTHKGVHSFSRNGSAALYGDVTVSGSANILATQALQDVSFSITGQIPLANGGTGLNAVPTDGQLLIGGTTGNTLALATLTGTANQVNVANGQNSITLSTPQDIATASTVQFGAIGINAANSTVKADINGDLALRRSADNTTAGTLNDVSTLGTSFFRFTLATTLTGLANGYTGKILCITNINSVSLAILNENVGSVVANRIITGTGADISLAAGASLLLRYDDGASRWRVAGGSGSGGGFSEDATFSLKAGTNALSANTTSQYNLALLNGAAQNVIGSGTTGDNIAIGHLALQGAASSVATRNVAIGASTLQAITTGTQNTAIGGLAGQTAIVANALTTGTNATFLGYGSGPGSVGAIGLNFMTAVGSNAVVDSANTIVLGRSTDTTVIGTTAINANATALLQIAGNIALTNIATKSANYSIVTTDSVIIADASTAAFTITLPNANIGKGTEFKIKKKDSSANVVTVATVSSQLIDGATTFNIGTQYASITIVSDGIQWWVI